MSAQIVLENEFITIWYYPETKIIHHKMHKHLYGQAFRDAMSLGSETLKKNLATKWLSDDRDNAVVNKEDEEWAKTVWFAETLKAGWKFWAVVQPAKILGQMNIKRIVETFSSAGIKAQFFSDPDEAMTWLKAQ